MISKLGLKENVSLLGRKDREYVYAHLCDYDMLILPSRSEGFGLTVVEAMCAKVPVMVSNLEGPMEVIDGGRLGYTFASDDVDDLSAGLCRFISEGPDMSIIGKAYEFALKEFDINVTADKYMSMYKKVIRS